jgi:hypothetical protein
MNYWPLPPAGKTGLFCWITVAGEDCRAIAVAARCSETLVPQKDVTLMQLLFFRISVMAALPTPYRFLARPQLLSRL